MLMPRLVVHCQIFALWSLGVLGGLSANAQEAQPPAFDLQQIKEVLSQEIEKILLNAGQEVQRWSVRKCSARGREVSF
jgi:hypothetical protein